MRAMPVNPATGKAPGEAVLRKIDVRGDLLEDGFFVDILERSVAFQASGKYVEIFQIECAKHLLDLRLVIAACNEQALRVMPARGQPRVPSQDDAVLGAGNPDDFIVFVFIR